MKLLDIMCSPWMIRTERLGEIQALYMAHMRGDKIDFKALEARAAASTRDDYQVRETYDVIDGVAVINISGVVTKRSSFFSFFFGGASTQAIGIQLSDALENTAVRAILLNIDSPGGTVDGTQELAELIFASRGIKPIVSFTDGMMASAAYYIGAAADSVHISGDMPEVGSIGVAMRHLDYSESDKLSGYKETDIYAGRYKRIASGNRPLSKEAKDYLQEQVDYVYSIFVNDVARYRGVTVDEALEMADGRIFIGKQAIDAGLADSVSTFDRLVERMAAGDAAPATRKAAQKGKENEIMDLNELKEKHRDLYNQVLEEGRQEGKTAGEAEAKIVITSAASDAATAATAAETERIKSVREQLIPGHEALIEGLMFDGKTTGPEAAVKVLAADKVLRDQKAAEFAEGGARKLPGAGQETLEGKKIERVEKDPRLEVDRRAKAKMEGDTKLTYRQALNLVLDEDPALAKDYEGRN